MDALSFRRTAVGALLLALAAWIAVPCRTAGAVRRVRNPYQLTADEQKATGAALEFARSEYESASQAASAAGTALHAIEKEAAATGSALKQIENELENAEPADSECGKSRDAYRQAKAAYEAAKVKALEDPDYKRKAEELAADGDSDAALRKETIDDDSGVKEALGNLNEAKAKYDSLRVPLFQGNDRWKEAAENLKAKSKAAAEAEHQFAAAKMKRIAATNALREIMAAIGAGGPVAKQKAQALLAAGTQPANSSLRRTPSSSRFAKIPQAGKDSPAATAPPAADAPPALADPQQ